MAHDSDPGSHGRAGARRRHGGGVWLRRRGRRHRVRPGTSSAPASPSASDSTRPPSLRRPASRRPTAATRSLRRSSTRPSRTAIADGFPAMVPAGVPAGWTVLKAHYSPKGGGMWSIYLTDPNGAEVTLRSPRSQRRASSTSTSPDAEPGGLRGPQDFGTGNWDAYTGTAAAAVAKDALRHRGRGGRPRPGHGRRSSPRSCSPPRTPATSTAASRLPRTGRRHGRGRARPWSPGGAP